MIVTKGTRALIEKYYGEPPKDTYKSIVVVDDGKPLAIAGLKILDNKLIAFLAVKEDFRKHKSFKRIIAKGCKEWLRLLPNLPVYAICDKNIKGADVLLSHLGFSHYKGDTWLKSEYL